ncbi:transcriptional regulator [Paenibacillus nasutitermitis]|uniref:Transcriptional regulator n=2 Tax=Paenibacillus nasutitermitis TaxID=1652958 RepID=A0A916ZB11_9BACL|nr:transcriptional regulator [Paenibacillus nasutitermitis]
MDYTISSLPIRIVNLKTDPSKLAIPSLAISEIGHLPGRTYQQRKAEFPKWAFGYVVKGQGTFQINDGPIQAISPGSLFFVYSGAKFNYGPTLDNTWDEYYVRMEGSRVEEWISNWFQHEVVLQLGVHDYLVNKIETMFTLMDSGLPANADRAALLLETLIYEFYQLSLPQKETNKSESVFSVLDDITNSPYGSFDATVFAEQHHIAVSTLRRLVSKHTGYSLHEYVHRSKILEAKKLLLSTDQQVKEIALKLGYEDTFYFSRLFKKITGKSPSVFRENM